MKKMDIGTLWILLENLAESKFYLVPVTPLPNLMHWRVLDIIDSWVPIDSDQASLASEAMFGDINRIMQTALSLKSYPFIIVEKLKLRFHGVANVVDSEATIEAMAGSEVEYFEQIVDGLKMWTKYKTDFLGNFF
jgi:hypothetical protein